MAFIVACSISYQPYGVFAQEAGDEKDKFMDDMAAQDIAPYYNPYAEFGTTCEAGVSLAGGTNFEKITRYLNAKEMKPTAIAGILANLHVESHMSAFAVQYQANNTTEHSEPPEFRIVNGKRESLGYGIAQFTPTSKIKTALMQDSRTDRYVNEYFSTRYGGYIIPEWNQSGTGIPEGVPVAVNDAFLETQLDFFYTGEMQTTRVGIYRNLGGTMGLNYIQNSETIFTAMNNARDERDAARIFVWIYERPGHKPETSLEREILATNMLPAVMNILNGSTDFNETDQALQAATPSTGCVPIEDTHEFQPIDAGTLRGFQTTVKAFAWEDGRRGAMQKGAYTAALNGRYKGGRNGNDCGAFVSALMVKSGFDTTYPGTNTTGQRAWLDRNWVKIASPGRVNTANLRPGDVAIKTGHVFVWIGDVEGFVSKSAEAALGSNTAPTAIKSGNTYSDPSKYTWYRKREAPRSDVQLAV